MLASRRASQTFLLVLVALTGAPACGLISAGGGMDGSDVGSDGDGAGGTGGGDGAGGDTSSGGQDSPTGGWSTGGDWPGTGGCSASSPSEVACPGLCTALMEANCEAPSDYDSFAVDECTGGTRVIFSRTDSEMSCFYRGGSLVGMHASGADQLYCDGSSSSLSWGEQPSNCPVSSGASCSGGGEGGAGPAGPPANCFDSFSGSCAPCCPSPPPDCTNLPDGYPGYGCTANSCACTCMGGEWECTC